MFIPLLLNDHLDIYVQGKLDSVTFITLRKVERDSVCYNLIVCQLWSI
jgi:hypothetical protein